MNRLSSNRTVPSLLAVLAMLFAVAVASAAARADGQLDPSFGSGGHVTFGIETETGSEGVTNVFTLGDGRFLTIGPGDGNGLWATQNLPGGGLDAAFGSAGGTYIPQSRYSFVSDAVRQANGAIVAVGGEESAGGEFDSFVARLMAGGALDTTFGADPPNPTADGVDEINFGGEDDLDNVALDSSGRPILAGRVGPSGAYQVLLVRLNQDGSVDTTFGGAKGVHTNLGASGHATNLAIQGERILVIAGTEAETFLLGYRPDGTLDPGFGGGDGIVPLGVPGSVEENGLLVEPDGRIVLAVSSEKGLDLERLLPDGTPDTSFGSGGVTTFPVPSAAKLLIASDIAEGDDGKLLVAAGASSKLDQHVILLRVLPNGQPDPAWGSGGVLDIPAPAETDQDAGSVAIEPDRRVLVGGDNYNLSTSKDDRLVMRLLGDTTPPDTAITHAPKHKVKPSKKPVAFDFEAVGDVNTTFECELVRPKAKKKKGRHHRAPKSSPAFSACTSPVSYSKLRAPGGYRFAVRATDPAGNVDASPATAKFRLTTARRHPKHHHRR